jgi:DNA-binding CsgD family transcriptional regulator
VIDADEFIMIGQLIAPGDRPDFCDRLATWLRQVARAEIVTVVVYRDEAPPVHLYDDFRSPGARAGMINYLTQTYVLNAFFQRHCGGLASGVYRLRDLAPDGYLSSEIYRGYEVLVSEAEEIGYVTAGWPKGLEEVDIAVSLGTATTAEIGLYRPVIQGGFDDGAVERLRHRLPVVAAAFQHYWAGAKAGLAPEAASSSNPAQAAFDTFGSSLLTVRERQVASLILQGHSSESIAARLEISLTTVKTHRKRCYQKLNISTQAELLAQFLQSMERSRPAA